AVDAQRVDDRAAVHPLLVAGIRSCCVAQPKRHTAAATDRPDVEYATLRTDSVKPCSVHHCTSCMVPIALFTIGVACGGTAARSCGSAATATSALMKSPFAGAGPNHPSVRVPGFGVCTVR